MEDIDLVHTQNQSPSSVLPHQQCTLDSLPHHCALQRLFHWNAGKDGSMAVLDSARLKSMGLLLRTFVAASLQEALDKIYCGQRYVHIPLLESMPCAAVLLALSL